MSFSLESRVDIYDSNVWVHGLTRKSADAEARIQEVIDNERCVLVTPYIYEEVDQAIQRDSDNQQAADELRDRFAQMMSNPFISDPNYQEVSDVDLGAVRSDPTVQAFAEVLEIQAKDVPILQAAQQCSNPNPTIFTNDEDFYELSERRERYNLERIEFEYVEYPK
ncbi:hypothetical protein ATJ93_4292 [Halopiger aswanensis]|uniref:PIN domain-containing protein n=1 Tax=Halopiger aswanensis TaxID=148449 RepID=A0A419VZP0_9EURY|nr:hypothetical protein ATJ93_4292 [Halopiger aswanensis]